MEATSSDTIETEISMDRPSAARMYDYLLGGAHNFAADREAADRLCSLYPDARRITWANRAFLRRAVRFLVEQGIDQFLDIGSGIPTAGNVHEVAHRENPAVRVVYVDIDPIAVHHSLAVLKDIPVATAIRADARQPGRILNHPEVRRLLDFNRPVGVLLVTLLHFITDDNEAREVAEAFREAMPAGSYMVIGHAAFEGTPRESMEQIERVYAGMTNPARARSRAQVATFFEGLELVPPGPVYAPLWRPEDSMDVFLDCPERSMNLVGVGREPGRRQ